MSSLGRSLAAGLVVSLAAGLLLFPDPTGTLPLVVAPVAAFPVGAWLYHSGVTALLSITVAYVAALAVLAVAFAPLVLALALVGFPSNAVLRVGPAGVDLLAAVPVAGAALVARELVWRRGYTI